MCHYSKYASFNEPILFQFLKCKQKKKHSTKTQNAKLEPAISLSLVV